MRISDPKIRYGHTKPAGRLLSDQGNTVHNYYMPTYLHAHTHTHTHTHMHTHAYTHTHTHQVPVAEFDVILCFGAVVPDGYGVCYNPQQQKTLLAVSCFRSCPDTDSALFLSKLEDSLREMRDVLEAARGPTPKL